MTSSLPPSKFGAGYTYGSSPMEVQVPPAPAPAPAAAPVDSMAPTVVGPYAGVPHAPQSGAYGIVPPAPQSAPVVPPAPQTAQYGVVPPAPQTAQQPAAYGYAPQSPAAPYGQPQPPAYGNYGQPARWTGGGTAIPAAVLAVLYGLCCGLIAVNYMIFFSSNGEIIRNWDQKVRIAIYADAIAVTAAALLFVGGAIALLARRSAGRIAIALGLLAMVVDCVVVLVTVHSLSDEFSGTTGTDIWSAVSGSVVLLIVEYAAIPMVIVALALAPPTRRWCAARTTRSP